MATRNFWAEVWIDGRTTHFSGGPQGAEGGMTIKLFVRDEGDRTKALDIHCQADERGRLTIELELQDEEPRAHMVQQTPEGFTLEYRR